MRVLFCLLALATAQADAQTDAVAPAVEAYLAAGDSAQAYRAIRAVRAPERSADLLRRQLQLELAGAGSQGATRPARQQQIVDAAERLLSRAPGDTLALRVLAGDRVWTARTWRDRVTLGHIRNIYGRFVTKEEVAARTARTRFDRDHRRAMGPDLSRADVAHDAHRAALAYLDTWLAVDLAAPRAYELAATLAVLTEAWDGLAALAARLASVSPGPQADLYAGLAHARLGDPVAAETAFDRALARSAPATQARFADVRPLLPRSAQAAYAADPAAVTAAFWAQADPALLTGVNERRAEHRARIVEADLLFGRVAGDLDSDTRRGSETDQGRIWVRYGRPQEAVRFFPDEDSTPIYGPDLYLTWDYPDFRFVFTDGRRDGDARLYVPPDAALVHTTSARNDNFEEHDERMQRDDPERLHLAPARPLDVPMLASRFRAPGGGLDVVLGWGVPVESVGVPVQTGAFAIAGGAVVDRAAAERSRLGSGRATAAGGSRVWAEAAVVRVPGARLVRAEVMADAGAARGATSIAVEPLPGGFAVSDLLLALAVDDEGRGPVVRDGLGIVPAPRAAFQIGDPVYVVIEAYGLGLDDGQTRYTVEAELRPVARRGGLLGRILGRGQGPGVAVRTEGSGARPDETLSFFIDVRDREPGRYTLRVEVRDETTGAARGSEREIRLD